MSDTVRDFLCKERDKLLSEFNRYSELLCSRVGDPSVPLLEKGLASISERLAIVESELKECG